MRTLAPGLIVGGKYRLLRALGEGGMGAVFEVEHVVTHKRAALKWLHPELGAYENGQSRLLQEARATSRVRHRNVVDLYDVLEDEGALYLVMELLAGELLSHWLAGGDRTLGQLLALLVPVMEGIAAAHAVGVVHRDIKPANIFLACTAAPEPVPKVIDFGISRTFDGERLTCSGMAMGTPRYVSYEQLRGERDVDGRSDVYAFGVMLYEALVGRAPHEAKSFAEQAIRFATTPPPLPRLLRPELPLALEAVLLRAIARDRADRYPDAAALIAALAPFADPAHPCAALPLWRPRPMPDAAPTLRSPREGSSRSTPEASASPRRVRSRLLRWAIPGALLLSLALLAQGVRVHGAASTQPALPRARAESPAVSKAIAADAAAQADAGVASPVREHDDARTLRDAHRRWPTTRQRARTAPPPVDVASPKKPLDVATQSSTALRAGTLRRHEF
ncbi:MAG: serine/threonine-protein kinase [Polyangiales bacterium]